MAYEFRIIGKDFNKALRAIARHTGGSSARLLGVLAHDCGLDLTWPMPDRACVKLSDTARQRDGMSVNLHRNLVQYLEWAARGCRMPVPAWLRIHPSQPVQQDLPLRVTPTVLHSVPTQAADEREPPEPPGSVPVAGVEPLASDEPGELREMLKLAAILTNVAVERIGRTAPGHATADSDEARQWRTDVLAQFLQVTEQRAAQERWNTAAAERFAIFEQDQLAFSVALSDLKAEVARLIAIVDTNRARIEAARARTADH